MGHARFLDGDMDGSDPSIPPSGIKEAVKLLPVSAPCTAGSSVVCVCVSIRESHQATTTRSQA